jgi:hypothetical protein
MQNVDPAQAVFRSDAEQLSKILSLNESTGDAWTERDLPAMLRHQLAAPLQLDLSSLELRPSEMATRDHTLKEAAGSGIRTFQDLLEHPRPPLAPLNWAKNFFKQQAGPSLPRRPEQEVAYVLYLLSILVARIRLQTRISKLSNADLLKGIDWAADRKWLDMKTREMCRLAQKALRAGLSG